MSRSLAAGIYAEQPGTHMIFGNNRNDPDNPLAKARPAVVIVVGLGDEGRLRSVDLVNSVRQGTLAYVERQRDEGGGGAGLSLSVTLIGTGAVGVSAGRRAARRAGSARSEREGGRVRFPRYHQPALRRALPRPRQRGLARAARSGDRPAARTEAGCRRDRNGGCVATRARIEATGRRPRHPQRSERRTPSGDRVIAFTLSTRRASGDVRTQIALALARARAGGQGLERGAGDPQIGRTLLELLVPVEMEPFLGGVDEMVIELDAGTADCPGSCSTPPRSSPAPIRGRGRSEASCCASSGPLRSGRRCPTAPAASSSSASRGSTLVVSTVARRAGGGAGGGGVLPGAGVLALSGDADARAIINALFERPYRILHVAGHGASGAGGGIVPARELSRRGGDPRDAHRSGLVFINCCHVVEREVAAISDAMTASRSPRSPRS